jgi:hypothetical protein
MVAALRRPVKLDNESVLAQSDAMEPAAEGCAPALVALRLAPELVEQLRDALEAAHDAIHTRSGTIAR